VTNGTDIAKRVFHVPDGKAVFYYHFAQSQITGTVKTYLHTRGPMMPTLNEFALSQEVGLDDDPDNLQEAATIERECYSFVKSSFVQNEQMINARASAETLIVVEQNVFEKALDAVDREGGNYSANNSAFDQVFDR
jgi:hypothetical protein